MHILFVDDSRSAALLVTQFLEQLGYEVTYAATGEGAVAAYRECIPDLILMDVVMPGIGGIEATRQIKALGAARWVPVMLMTGLSEKEDIVAGFDAGADDYLIKPIDLDVLAARMRSMQRIAAMQDSLAGILDNVFEAILTIDEQGIVQSYNKAAERIFGYKAGEVLGHNVNMLMPSPYREQHDGYLARYMQERTPRIIGSGRKVEGRRKDGEVFPVRLAVTEVRKGEQSQFIGVVSDISDEEAARRRIEFMALHDALTGLPNRTCFNDVLTVACQRANAEKPVSVLFIDLDGFKPINDQLGHEAGDQALLTVAKRFRHALAEKDMVARLGGDEFVVLMHGGAEAAAQVAQRLLQVVSRPMSLLDQTCEMGASIGIAVIPTHGSDANAVLSAADNAMYQAKRGGKRRFVIAG